MTVDAVVLSGHGIDTHLLVVRRARPPFAHDWALPGGFVDPFESLAQAAVRECREETTLELRPSQGRPLLARGADGRDPRGWTITQPFLFWIPDRPPVSGSDDAEHADWVPVSQIDGLAFDHGAILCDALARFWPLFPAGARELAAIAPWSVPANIGTEPVFYAGSFQPMHQGHAACIDLCRTKARRPIVVIPDRSPFKPSGELGCQWRRFRAIERACVGDDLSVYPGFLALEHSNPTVDWFPSTLVDRHHFLMGADSLASLPRWIQSQRLVNAIDVLYVAPRETDAKAVARARDWVRSINPNCQIIDLPHHQFEQLSSTQMRASNRT